MGRLKSTDAHHKVLTSTIEATFESMISHHSRSTEQVPACCSIAREKLDVGDYSAGCAALQPWWTLGQWPEATGTWRLRFRRTTANFRDFKWLGGEYETSVWRAEASRSTSKWCNCYF